MNTEYLLQLADKNILFVAERKPVVMQKGKGMYLYDTEGNKYLDFIGGWAVNALGHSPQAITKALKKQSSLLVNCSPSFYNQAMLEFSELITKVSGLERVFFCSTGAEANESAIKLARKYGQKFKKGAYKIISFENSFHGRTLSTMAMSGKNAFKPLFEPKTQGFIHLPLNDIDAIKKNVNEEICAVILEPIQGEGGVREADVPFVNSLRELCVNNNVLLIMDEIQTGLGRTGKMFAYEHYGILPDILTLGKGIGGGFPLAAMLAHEKLNIFEKGEQGGTYSSQPLGMAVGYAVLQDIIKRNLADNANKIGNMIIAQLNGLSRKYPIKDIRGKGLLLAFDTDGENAARIVDMAFELGLILNSPGPSSIRIIPPLTVKEKHVFSFMEILEKVLKSVYS